MNENLPIPGWDEYFMRQCYLVATKSKDLRTRIGSVLVRDKRIIATGYNGFPPKINDNDPIRNSREFKYTFVSHSEANTCYQCAKFGISSCDSILYSFSEPCNECAKTLICCGVKEIVIHKQNSEYWHNSYKNPKWEESCNFGKIMFEEAGIIIRQLDQILNVQALVDGKIVSF